MKQSWGQAAATGVLAALLAGCGPSGKQAELPAAENSAETAVANLERAPEPTSEGKSIIRPEAEPNPEPTQPPLEPIEQDVQFPAGVALDAAATAALDALLAEPALQAGGPITLRGHSDSKGDDAKNLRASRRRAEAVRDYLVGKGVAKDRITVIALGEARPVAPNAKPDGSDDKAGRARNRRVGITVALPQPAPEASATPEPAPKLAG
ncbi:OmpA family protein [Sphingomonas sp. PL-96]|uniref:OmpA family protein n=1 Tax=Sphingomonas sp. PL-96 TaxID=2887201 RepID=UPI001E401371|nr:OmpA family protein [Sphingomonas sp. PL-96]MCC2975581.1 OmpA family protein [Sphingomonas sp. PL-96]